MNMAKNKKVIKKGLQIAKGKDGILILMLLCILYSDFKAEIFPLKREKKLCIGFPPLILKQNNF